MSSRRSVHFNRHLEIVDRVINSLLKEKLIQFGFIVSAATERAYRVFSLTWPASMQIYWNKKKSVCIRKEFNSQRTRLGHQHGRRFLVWGHQYGRPDVM